MHLAFANETENIWIEKGKYDSSDPEFHPTLQIKGIYWCVHALQTSCLQSLTQPEHKTQAVEFNSICKMLPANCNWHCKKKKFIKGQIPFQKLRPTVLRLSVQCNPYNALWDIITLFCNKKV